MWAQELTKLISSQNITGLHRYLLFGPPGTGKSSFIPRIKRKYYRITVHEDMSPAELLGMWQIRQNETVFVPGPAPLAMREGLPLIIDEITEASQEVETLLHQILDDLTIAEIQLPNGERVKPKTGFTVIATTNDTPDIINEALLDRFDVVLYADKPAPGILNNIGDESMRELVTNFYSNLSKPKVGFKPTVRRVMAVNNLLTIYDLKKACDMVFLDNGPAVFEEIQTIILKQNKKGGEENES